MSDLPITDPFVQGFWKGVHVQVLAHRTASYLKSLKTLGWLQLQAAELQFKIDSKKVKRVEKVDLSAKALNELDEMAAVLLKNAEKIPTGEIGDGMNLLNFYGLCESECKFLKPAETPGVAFHRTWFVNLLLLLRLKKIKNVDETVLKFIPRV
jgi:hypothetical protein